jgi:octaprenyl-diphosphate synthase
MGFSFRALPVTIASTAPAASSLPAWARFVAEDMARVDALTVQRLRSDVALVNQVGHYIVSAGGKRLRPVLVLLVSGALGCSGPERFELAAVVEFIHTATLLHDDVVDESSLRRGRKTANALFGNAASVLVGDFLYSRAFQMMVSVNRMRVLDILAEATNVIAEGEVLQLMNMHDPDLDLDDYMRVIRLKTAKLFEASAQLGAVIADAPPDTEAACARFGQALGTAFQIIDDCLDYDGSAEAMGKNVGDDLREGKVTLPMMHAMQRAPAAQRAVLREAIEHGDTSRLDEVVRIVRASGALEATRETAAAEARRALDCLHLLPAGPHKEALVELTAQSVHRLN